MRSYSALPKTILPKFLLALFQKPVNTYANPGAPLMKLYPPADLLHRPFKKIADFKYQFLQLQKPNKQREYQQICADQRLSTKL